MSAYSSLILKWETNACRSRSLDHGGGLYKCRGVGAVEDHDKELSHLFWPLLPLESWPFFRPRNVCGGAAEGNLSSAKILLRSSFTGSLLSASTLAFSAAAAPFAEESTHERAGNFRLG